MSSSSNSTANYMENVPVKIAEKYKPPPRISSIPQAIKNKLSLPDNYYQDNSQFSYDFQLERNVIKKITEWRQMRAQKKDARRERMEKREQQRLRDMEAQQKRLLGAVSYPSTAELSSDDDNDDENRTALCDDETKIEQKSIAISMEEQHNQTSSFHNILQPTILAQAPPPPTGTTTTTVTNIGTADNMVIKTQIFTNSVLGNNKNNNNNSGKAPINSAFNYRDFEQGTASPFDDYELKTINDLDILAQVLNKTQLDMESESKLESELQLKANEDVNNVEKIDEQTETKDNLEICVENTKEKTDIVVDDIENTKSALRRIDFKHLDENIPVEHSLNSSIITETKTTTSPAMIYQQVINNHYPYNTTTTPNPVYYCGNSGVGGAVTYNGGILYNGLEHHQQQHHHNHNQNQNHHQQTIQNTFTNYNQQNSNLGIYNQNQNYLYTTAMSNCNEINSVTPYYNTSTQLFQQQQQQHQPTPQPQLVGQHDIYSNNANNYPNILMNNFRNPLQSTSGIKQLLLAKEMDADINSKSKSVPDILKELSDEVHNSKMRRSRNYSQNHDEINEKVETTKDRSNCRDDDNHDDDNVSQVKIEFQSKTYAKLGIPMQKLAMNISLMGFPLERVAKIVEIVGDDDKKIVEHLIPLSELMDLGFEEAKISEALLKFDNNKEKALEYLIS